MKQRHSLTFDEWEKEALKDPVLKREYERLEPEFAPIMAILEARKKKGMTQARLARKMKTTQSVIARVESGRANPTLSFLLRLAEALGRRLIVRFA